MRTPIADFAASYAASAPARFHMPGHKGHGALGCEALDMTEIAGADDLFRAEGVILESEQNAAALFGAGHTFYSTEGATLVIKAMLALVARRAPHGTRPCILAARNAHKAFLYGCGLLDLDVTWLYPETAEHPCVCRITPQALEAALSSLDVPPVGVYVTSPDYLGNVQNIAALSSVCRAHGVPLLVDNAHGAYLAFSDPVRHPLALGATMCTDSAHKTLPVLTGGAYLHIAKDAPRPFAEEARDALALFASTSPSYLTLQSLDLCNRYLAGSFAAELKNTAKRVEDLRRTLQEAGYETLGDEPIKLTLSACARGYTGTSLADILRKDGIEVEFADRDVAVLMCTPHNAPTDFARAEQVLLSLPVLPSLPKTRSVAPLMTEQCVSVREALLAQSERVSVSHSVGRICAAPTVSCPPAVPIVMSGERITSEAAERLAAYGITEIRVLI